jgi:outer membrane protein TolC
VSHSPQRGHQPQKVRSSDAGWIQSLPRSGLSGTSVARRLCGRPLLCSPDRANSARLQGNSAQLEAQPSNQVLRGKWWETYQDPPLKALEEKITVSNQSLKASEAQFRQARDMARYYRADYFPTVSAGAPATRKFRWRP